MVISLQLDSDVPLYEQLRNQIVLGIASGQLLPNESLPTVRQMADELGINAMTVNKAYMLLKQERYIVIDRRHGAKVSPNIIDNAERSRILQDQLELIIAQAVIQGIDEVRFQLMCSSIFSKMRYGQS